MAIDITVLVLLAIAILKGWRRGLIVALFSLLGLVLGLMAAMKLSVVVAAWMEGSVSISARWLPILSFALVFITVVLLIRLLANMVQASVEFAWLGWANRIGGMALYLIIYLLAFSVILFYLVQLNWIGEEMIKDSVTYSYVEPWGPALLNKIGGVLPAFKDMFETLEKYFDNLAQKIPQSEAGM